ncbi:MAG: hypothetical protein ACLTYW_00045 [Collinsella sp.]
MFTGGRLTHSALSQLRSQGTLDFSGSAIPDEHDLVRVYYQMEDEARRGGDVRPRDVLLQHRHAKYNGPLVSAASTSNRRCASRSGKYGRYYTVKAGTNAVAHADGIFKRLGLRTNEPRCDYVLPRDVVYDPDDSWLKIANDLLAMAGFASAYPDAYGVIQMVPHVEPQARKPVRTFNDGEDSIMLPEVSRSDNADDIPNAVYLTYETEEESLWSECRNTDPNSRASIPYRGYEVPLVDQVTELTGATKEERLKALKAKAKTKLVDNSSSIEYVEWGHPWVPLLPNDAVGIDYLTAGLNWRGAITEQEIEVGGHCAVTGKARRFIRSGFVTETEGGSW